MLTICLYILAAVGVVFGCVVAVDLWLFLRRKLPQRKMTGWNDVTTWKTAVTNCGKRWIRKMPTVPLKDEQRFVLLDILRKQYKHSSAQAWKYALLVDGVGANQPDLHSFYVKNDIHEIDDGFAIYAEWNNGLLSEDRLQQLMAEYLDLVRRRTHANGLIEYRVGFGDVCLVDTIPFVCPLLIKWGYYNNEHQWIELALTQIKNYYKFAYIREHGLYAHAYDAIKGKPCESIGWGRGTGWYLLGLLFCYNELADGEERAWLMERMEEAAENIVSLQQTDGGWCTQLVGSWNYDSTVTAIFTYFLYEMSTLCKGDLYVKNAEKGLQKLMKSTRADGAVEFCEGDCHGVGKYSILYSVSPFGQGMTLKAIAAKEKFERLR